MIKSFDQFEQDGCDNCERYLSLKNDRDKVYECTSSNFDGVTALLQPEDSWVAKWLRLSRCKPGVYAVSVSGNLPVPIQREVNAMGINYRPGFRDASMRT